MTAADETELEVRAASLLADAWGPALSASYRMGWQDGHAAGYRDADRDMAETWAQAAAGVRAVLDQPTQEEIGARRQVAYQPCRTRCGACSACIATEAYERRGLRPYLGAQREADLARCAS